MNITLYQIAERFVGIREVPGRASNPAILAMLKLDQSWPEDDSVPWCSGAMNYWAWLLRLPRSKSLRARSWLLVGQPIGIDEAAPGFDVVIFTRGDGPRDPDIIDAPGHVGLYSAHHGEHVWVLGGNQSDSVSVARYRRGDLLGVRRIWMAQGTE